MLVQFKHLTETSTEPTKASTGAAGFDLYADLPQGQKRIYPGQRLLVKTGIAFAIPEDHVGIIAPRSGLAAKSGITVLNGPGIIDSDYRGDVGVILMNEGENIFEVNHKDRIAQILFMPVATVLLSRRSELDDTVRACGGFGSTGIAG